jgi:hypothetical protein
LVKSFSLKNRLDVQFGDGNSDVFLAQLWRRLVVVVMGLMMLLLGTQYWLGRLIVVAAIGAGRRVAAATTRSCLWVVGDCWESKGRGELKGKEKKK